VTLKCIDYPLDQFRGYFEFIDAFDAHEPPYLGEMAAALTGNADAMERAAVLKRKLDALSPGDVVARVYPNGAAPLEFVGSPAEAEAFVAAEMQNLKVKG
jgi:hypothetical protein